MGKGENLRFLNLSVLIFYKILEYSVEDIEKMSDKRLMNNSRFDVQKCSFVFYILLIFTHFELPGDSCQDLGTQSSYAVTLCRNTSLTTINVQLSC